MGKKKSNHSKLAKKLKKRRQGTIPATNNNLSLQLYNAGKLKEAETACLNELNLNPSNPAALYVAGMLAIHLRQCLRALDFFNRAVAASPKFAEAYFELGTTCNDLGRYEEAIISFREVLALGLKEARVYNNMATSYKGLNNIAEAINHYQKALQIDPNFYLAHFNLGVVYHNCGRIDDAISSLQKAIGVNPNSLKAWDNLGSIFYRLGRYEEAANCCRNSIKINSRDPIVHNKMAVVLMDLGLMREAEASCKKALELDADFAPALNTLGNLNFHKGEVPEAISNFRKSLALASDHNTHSNLLFYLNYTENDNQKIYEESLQWNELHGAATSTKGSIGGPNRKGRVKIGYLSPDFRSHSVSYFIEPVIACHDRENFEVFCYANIKKPDSVTQRLKEKADKWHDIRGMDDKQVIDLIRENGIDILIDLAGHSKGNRLQVFTARPAPIQMTWLGYPNTTGISAMDYRLTDAVADPPGDADDLHSEELIRLPHGFLCYQPAEGAPEDTKPPPSLDNGFTTFGSFNNAYKISTETIRIWSTILKSVADSRLILKSHALSTNEIRKRYLEKFEKAGISSERIELVGWLPNKDDHLNLYGKIDIGLDPFPYNGTTTTFESLWMGVPVITLRGVRHSGRVGASIMHHIGLREFIAESEDEYKELALSLASDTNKLTELRSKLRRRLQDSPLMDGRKFTMTLEKIYQDLLAV